MEYTPDVALVDFGRGVLALVLAGLSTLVNYGDAVTTSTDAGLWFVYVALGTYVVFTVFSVAGRYVWDSM